MSNPLSGLINQDFKDLFTNAIDALLEDTALTVPCRLIFGTTKNTACPNCNIDSLTNMSANTYKAGGPSPFPNGSICPMCAGIFYISQDTSIIMNLAVIWNNKRSHFINIGLPLKLDQAYVETISKISTLPNLSRAKEVIFDTNIEGYAKRRFQRYGDPTPVQYGRNPYIVTLWERAG